jgi:dihydroorotate dehydrogenase (NAD+) catalytic subunit
LKPIALATVHACYAATRLPIVGMGGVTNGRDVLDLVACGARDVALGTVLFSDPAAPARVRSELAEEDVERAFAGAHETPFVLA